MLRPTELLPTNPGLIDQTLVEAFVREGTFAQQSCIEMAEALVAKDAVDEPYIVPEIARRAGNQIARRRGGIAEAPLALRNQSQRFQRGEQGPKTIFGNPGFLRQFDDRVSAARNP